MTSTSVRAARPRTAATGARLTPAEAALRIATRRVSLAERDLAGVAELVDSRDEFVRNYVRDRQHALVRARAELRALRGERMNAGAPILDEQTLAEYEGDVVDALATLIDCSYGDASGIVSLHVDIIEAGYEEHEHPSVIASEIDAQSDAGGVPQPGAAAAGLRSSPVRSSSSMSAGSGRRTCSAHVATRRAPGTSAGAARKRIMEVLVDVTSERVQMQTEARLRVVGATSSSARLARAQARAEAYAEILEPIVTAWGEGASDEDVAASGRRRVRGADRRAPRSARMSAAEPAGVAVALPHRPGVRAAPRAWRGVADSPRAHPAPDDRARRRPVCCAPRFYASTRSSARSRAQSTASHRRPTGRRLRSGGRERCATGGPHCMKTLALANQKGGVGKSAVAVQLAYYFARSGKRVLVIDFDHQGNATKALATGGLATISEMPASRVLTVPVGGVEDEAFVVLPADGEDLRGLERRDDEHQAFVTHLSGFLDAVADSFDVCIVDTNPNPDIRQLAALVTASHVLSPIELTQESVDGIGALLNDDSVGVRRIQATIRPDLVLLGVLPNKVDGTSPFQKQNLRDLATHYADLLIAMDGGTYAWIPRSTAVTEAQAAGVPLWRLGRENGGTTVKTSAREAWRQILPVFDRLAVLMELR